MGYLLKSSSTAKPLLFLMVDSADHLSPKTGLSPTVTISKNGAAFASPAGAVTELANGWYKVAGNATDTATVGPLVLHATGSGADPTDEQYNVVAFDPDSATSLGLSNLDAAVTSRMATYTQPTGFLAATFPGTVASPTNITAGTITTVTNLTNAPTSGDLTATMKTSVANAVWNEAQSGHTTAGTFGKYVDAAISGVSTGGISAGDIATAVWQDLTAGSDFSTVGSVGKLVKDNVNAAVGSVPTAVMASTAPDGVAASTILSRLNAFAKGHRTVTNNGNGTYTIAFKAEDNTTTLFSVTFNPTTGVVS